MPPSSKNDERTFILECINVYRSLPALWNIKHSDYNNRVKKKEQYELLLQKYKEKYPDADKQLVVRKINSLRTNFRKELKRINDAEKSGAASEDIVAQPTLWYFHAMLFLKGQEEPCTTQNSMQPEEDDSTFGINAVIHQPEPPRKKSRKTDELQELISLARTRLLQPQTEYEQIAAIWAIDLQKMDPRQQLFAKKAVNEILFEGQLGTLEKYSVQINQNNNSNSSSPLTYDVPKYEI